VQQPGGNRIVAVMFTDIEGSTSLTTRLGDEAAQKVVDARHAIVRSALARHGGEEHDEAGDGLMVTFPSARSAASCALEIQGELLGERVARVRIGLHAGDVLERNGRPHGATVAGAARVCARASGGQILASEPVRDLVGTLPGVAFKPGGRFVPKGFDETWRLFDVVALEGAATQRMRAWRRPFRGRPIPIGLVAACLVVGAGALVAGVVLILSSGGSGSGARFTGNAVGYIDAATNQLVDVTALETRPANVASDAQGAWLASPDDHTILRVDAGKQGVTRAVPVGNRVSSIALDGGTVRALDERTGLLRSVDAATGLPGTPLRLYRPSGSDLRPNVALAVGGGNLWVSAGPGRVDRVDLSTGRVVQRVNAFESPVAVAADGTASWVVDAVGDSVTPVDQSGAGDPVRVGRGPDAVAVGAGSVWVANELDDTVTRIDRTRRTALSTIAVGSAPSAVVVAAGAVWVANRLDGTVSRIDPAVNRVVATIDVGGAPDGLSAAGDRVWVSAAAAAPPAPRGGGSAIMSIEDPDELGSLDPAVAYTYTAWQILHASCGQLMTFPNRRGPAGAIPVPDLATGPPRVTNGARTYTFTIRSGVRFSSPSTQTVTAASFAHAIERALAPKTIAAGPGSSLFGDIVGVQAFSAGRAPHVSGLVARGQTLRITIQHADWTLPARLAVPTLCAVPTDVPPVASPGVVGSLPSAGPYVVTEFVPGTRAVLERNPRYRGPRPARLDRIEVSRVGSDRAVSLAEQGRIDYVASGMSQATARRLNARYGPGSPAARAGHQRYFEQPELNLDLLMLNTSRPLFASVRLRQAANFAVDRRALTSIDTGPSAGLVTQRPTDQYLPPTMPGYVDAHVYPLNGPDLGKARQLAGSARRHAVMYTCRDPGCRNVARIVRRNLAAIGIAVTVKSFEIGDLFRRESTPGEPFDIAFLGWGSDYPDPSDFLNRLFSGSAIGTPSSVNFSFFDDPAFNRRLAAANALPPPGRYEAYRRLDDDLVRAAPAIAYANAEHRSFISARIGCHFEQPVYGIDLTSLCLR
jgi:peptide/nickel transport system substrate-binding protein